MKYILLMILVAVMPPATHARRQATTRNVRNAGQTHLTPTPVGDTVTVTLREVRLSGYDKPLRSTRESLFVTSSLPDTIRALRVKIDYYDMSGRRLHSRDVDIVADIPPADTRNVNFKSWDTQKSFYYHLGAKPRSGTATPYKVEADVIYVITSPRQ